MSASLILNYGFCLMAVLRFARGIEMAYRTMSQQWCAEHSSSPQ